jgi:alpha-D-xyloside xylohydrolase
VGGGVVKTDAPAFFTANKNMKTVRHFLGRKTGLHPLLLVLAMLGSAWPVSAVTLTLQTNAPSPGIYDLYNFVGTTHDSNNVDNGTIQVPPAGDAYTYLSGGVTPPTARPNQGQTFTTGTNNGGYLITGFWLQHVLYSDIEYNGTYWQLNAGDTITVRVVDPSKAGGSGFALDAENYSVTGSEDNGAKWTGGGTVGDGMWLHFTLATPVPLAANRLYGFDALSQGANTYFSLNGTNNNAVFSGGTAWQGTALGGAAGAPDNTYATLRGSRVFLAQLTPITHPTLVIQPVSNNQAQLSWLASATGFILQSSTNVTGPWNYSGLAVTNQNGTNEAMATIGSSTMFYQLLLSTSASPIPVLSVQSNASGATLQMSPGTMELQVFSPGVIRVAYSPSNSIRNNFSAVTAQPTNSGWTLTQSANQIQLTTSALQVRVNQGSGAVGFYDTNGLPILVENPTGGKTLTPAVVGGINTLQSRQQFVISSNEGIYGLGQQQSGAMNYRGTTVHLQQKNPGQSDIPVLVSSRGYGLLWDNPAISDVSVAQSSATNLTWTSEAAASIDYYFMYGTNLDNVIGEYRGLTGTPPMFGKWAWGLWQCKNAYSNQAQILGVITNYQTNNIPIDCIVQDWQYWAPTNAWGSHQFDMIRYPNVPLMLETLHAENIHMIVSVWARFDLNIANANALSAVNGLYTNIVPNVYPAGQGQWYDPFNPNARQVYWQEIATNLFSLGLDGWWFDASEPELSGNWGEYVNYTTAAGSGARVFNAYPLMHTTSAYVGQRATNSSKRVLILTRSAYAGQQRNAAVTWSGDINGTFPVLAIQVADGINFSMSGVPYWTTDTGGFNDNTPGNTAYDEIFTRWFQFSTFCPLLRIHGNNDKALYLFPAATEAILTNYDALRYHLVPYNYSVAWMVTSQGYTMMRGLVMDFQSDTNVYNIASQYMFGPAIMVNPVTVAGATNRSVYLPTGTGWVNFWTGQTNAGGQTVSATATIDTMPLFVRAGSIIPYGPAIQHATQSSDPIELRVYPGANGSFTLYEDEGDNYDYETGAYATIPITWNDATQTLTIGERQGSFPGMLSSHTFNVVWVSSGHGVGVASTPIPDVVVPYNGAAVQITGTN